MCLIPCQALTAICGPLNHSTVWGLDKLSILLRIIQLVTDYLVLDLGSLHPSTNKNPWWVPGTLSPHCHPLSSQKVVGADSFHSLSGTNLLSLHYICSRHQEQEDEKHMSTPPQDACLGTQAHILVIQTKESKESTMLSRQLLIQTQGRQGPWGRHYVASSSPFHFRPHGQPSLHPGSCLYFKMFCLKNLKYQNLSKLHCLQDKI